MSSLPKLLNMSFYSFLLFIYYNIQLKEELFNQIIIYKIFFLINLKVIKLIEKRSLIISFLKIVLKFHK